MSKARSKSQKTQKFITVEKGSFRLFPFPNDWMPLILLAMISFGIYFNSIQNENALDDGIIIQKNEFVLKGMKGIKDIMTKDSYYSFYRQMNAEDQLKGGRYRPLSVVTFAIEQEFIGPYPIGNFAKFADLNRNGAIEPEEANWWKDINKDNMVQETECVECWDKNMNFKRDTLRRQDKSGRWVPVMQRDTIPDAGKTDPKTGRKKLEGPGLPLYEEDINKDGNVNDKDCEVEGHVMRHFNNVFFYMLSIIVLFVLLKDYLFRFNPDLAFLSTLFFAIHPIHTEVVANVKSRDEIFSIIFICLTLIYVFRYIENRSSNNLLVLLTVLAVGFLSYYAQLKPTTVITDVAAKKLADRNIFLHRALLAGLAGLAVLSGLRLFKIIKDNRNSSLIMAGLMFWLAWLSKEYAFTLLFLVPMSIWLFRKNVPLADYIRTTGVLFFCSVIYIIARFSSVKLNPGVPDTEVLNNPYLFASGIEKVATKIFVLLKYLQLQFFPHPLSSDYSFNTIEYRNFKDLEVWLSLVLNVGLAVLAAILFFKRKPVAFAFLFYFANLFMVGNILFDIGATMGERLVFHSSLGVCIGIAWLLTEGLEKFVKAEVGQKVLVIVVTSVIVVAGSYKTWMRNYDWKNDITLFIHDVETVPNSVLVLGNAGARSIDKSEWPVNTMIKDSLLRKAKGYLSHAIELHPTYVNGYLNLGLAYYKLEDLDSAAITWKRAEQLYPTNPYLNIYYGTIVPRLMAEAYQKGQQKDYETAIKHLRTAYWLQPGNPETSYNLGGAFHSIGMTDSAEVYFRKALQLKPDHKQAIEGLNSIMQAKGLVPQTIKP